MILQYRKLHKYKYQTWIDIEYLLPDSPSLNIKDVCTGTTFIQIYHGKLFVKKYYAWDGASGPTWDDNTNMRGSLIHDALCQLMREGRLDRNKWWGYAADVLRDVCIEDGMSQSRANLWCWAVKKFGRGNSKPAEKPENEIITI